MVTQKTSGQSSHRLLSRLASLYGVQTRYRDALGRERQTSVESLLCILRALGARLGDAEPRGLASAVEDRERALASRTIEPVVLAWEGILPALPLRLEPARMGATAEITLTLEDGSSTRGAVRLRQMRDMGDSADGFGSVPVRLSGVAIGKALQIGGRLPVGYHRLRVEADGVDAEALVVAAPRRCWEPQPGWDPARMPGSGPAVGRPRGARAGRRVARGAGIDAPLRTLAGKDWGLFAPVYALRSSRDWGAGDLAELETLVRWTGEQGGSLVATLPLLASSFGTDADPSPYRPHSRLFWNELFLAPEMTREWKGCEAARSLSDAADARCSREALRESDFVDYGAVMALKRPVIEELARCFFDRAGAASRRDYEGYLRAHPFALDYAAFRAAEEAGAAGPCSSPRSERYHLYCQWQMDRNLAALSGDGRPGLLFDLPLGVHPRGFDVRRWPGLFATGMTTGAPPDAFFTNGQDWRMPPLYPEADRRDGHAYFVACLQNLMGHASVLRIDHMMSFHRLFWIPEGGRPKDGAYVTYPAEELYAVLSRESHRFNTAIVGEDLGTVPNGVRASMGRHAVARTWIFLGTLHPRAGTLMAEVPRGAVVTMETHDMVPLAGFLQGDDIETRRQTGQLDSDGARREERDRRHLTGRLAALFGGSSDPVSSAQAILAGCLAFLGRSAARLVLVNLEDLLLERRPQNVPGTSCERPNWRRRMAVRVEQLPRRLD
jgi:4-alpha-glucanotransferase